MLGVRLKKATFSDIAPRVGGGKGWGVISLKPTLRNRGQRPYWKRLHRSKGNGAAPEAFGRDRK
jgi:hypothetical protein